ncbi:translation factor (SUA5) [Beauveria bassiana ARSEF 2860]|uniref:Threonylcarbamoyl-AMP synthase n=1 Tax=Beauveria bassiana (strain ARSEF 2860) TaxID=655819 RepID=J4KKY1_BEAB2|nr:translation factor (SUA5) [Beauveria bassiana ARSEF 2860]EJP61244.1 translation factor (SUA5) [Beauveria bassiana ARSEF 2860]
MDASTIAAVVFGTVSLAIGLIGLYLAFTQLQVSLLRVALRSMTMRRQVESYDPGEGSVPAISRDARQAFQTLKAGGAVVIPTDVGYALLASTQTGVQKIFTAKGREKSHNIGIIGTYQQHREIHVLPDIKFEFTRALTEDMGMIVGIIAKFDVVNLHPRLAALDKATLLQVTKGDTVSIAIPEGRFLRELGRLCDADPDGMLMFGTSANATGQGQRFRIEDIEPSVLDPVDLVVDYGLQK